MFRMFGGMNMVSVGKVRVVSRFQVVTGSVMFRRLTVVVCSLRVVMGSLGVMMSCFFGHFLLRSGSQGWFCQLQAHLGIIEFRGQSYRYGRFNCG
jgi:hypothetical protein